jgi:hypothetical protein
MELDDFVNRNSKQNIIKLQRDSNNNSALDTFLNSFKTELKNQRKKSIYWIIVLVMLGVVYLSVSTQANELTMIGYHLCVLGFVLGAIYLFFKSRPLPDSAYILPLAEFLVKAEKKMKFMNITDWLIIILLLLILGSGGGIIFTTRLLNYIDNLELLLIIWIAFFVALCIFAFVVSNKKWRIEQQSLLEEFQRARESLAEKIK